MEQRLSYLAKHPRELSPQDRDPWIGSSTLWAKPRRSKIRTPYSLGISPTIRNRDANLQRGRSRSGPLPSGDKPPDPKSGPHCRDRGPDRDPYPSGISFPHSKSGPSSSPLQGRGSRSGPLTFGDRPPDSRERGPDVGVSQIYTKKTT